MGTTGELATKTGRFIDLLTYPAVGRKTVSLAQRGPALCSGSLSGVAPGLPGPGGGGGAVACSGLAWPHAGSQERRRGWELAPVPLHGSEAGGALSEAVWESRLRTPAPPRASLLRPQVGLTRALPGPGREVRLQRPPGPVLPAAPGAGHSLEVPGPCDRCWWARASRARCPYGRARGQGASPIHTPPSGPTRPPQHLTQALVPGGTSLLLSARVLQPLPTPGAGEAQETLPRARPGASARTHTGARRPLLWRGRLLARLRAAGPLLQALLPALPPLSTVLPRRPAGAPELGTPPTHTHTRPLPVRHYPSSPLAPAEVLQPRGGQQGGTGTIATESLPEEVPQRAAAGPGSAQDAPGRPSGRAEERAAAPRPERVCKVHRPFLVRGAGGLLSPTPAYSLRGAGYSAGWG